MTAMKRLTPTEIALVAVLSATALVLAFTHGLTSPYLYNIEFMSVVIFVSGFCFGWVVGSLVGAIATTVWNLFPYPFVSPLATITVTSPVLLVIMAALGALYGAVGGLRGRNWSLPKGQREFAVFEMAFWGFALTFIFDIMSSVGFYLAYPVYPSVWEAIYLTFIPMYMVYPPIVHTLANTFIFAFIAPPLVFAIKKMPLPRK